MKWVANIIRGIRKVAKYAGIVLVVVDILGYSADKLEKYSDSSVPGTTDK